MSLALKEVQRPCLPRQPAGKQSLISGCRRRRRGGDGRSDQNSPCGCKVPINGVRVWWGHTQFP